MRKQYLLGLDLGTTNIKGLLLEIDGSIKNTVSESVSYSHGKNNSVEYDADEFFLKIASVIKVLVEPIKDAGQIAGISMVSASGNTVLLNENNRPIRQAINWMDRRFTDEMEEVLGNPDKEMLYNSAGWPYNKSFPLAHLSWLKTNEPDKFNRAKKICLITDYVNYRLTGAFKTNPSTATTSYLQDQKARIWSEEIIEKLSITAKMLPEIVNTGEILGGINAEAAELTGLLPGTTVVAGSFDHPGAARGLGVLEEGDLLLSCGTSWVGFYPHKNRSKLVDANMLVDPFLSNSGCWGGMFSLPSIGKKIDELIIKWISDRDDRYKRFNKEAEKEISKKTKLLINPMEDFHKNFSKYTVGEISYAIMEGTALLMKERIDGFSENGIIANRIFMAGGPTESKTWVKILCDILKADIQVSYGGYAGAVGAAVLAGIGTDVYIDEYDAFRKRRS